MDSQAPKEDIILALRIADGGAPIECEKLAKEVCQKKVDACEVDGAVWKVRSANPGRELKVFVKVAQSTDIAQHNRSR